MRQSIPPPSSGLPGRLPGLGRRRTVELRGNPNVGAAEIAPTAPHATVPAEKDTSKPARFWEGRGVRLAIRLALLLSIVFHAWVSPWKLFPDASGIKGKDVDDELTIPLDLLGEEAPPEKPPAPEPVNVNPEDDPNGLKKKPDAGPKPKPDAGIDAAPDAEALAEDAGKVAANVDAGLVPLADGGAPTDAGEADGGGEAGLIASAEAGAPPGANGPRDPGSMVGMAGLITAGQVNVTLLVNVAVIRQHPVGSRMGPLFMGIPQWASFMKGSTVAIDPIKDCEWILIYGPSLIHTDRDAVLVRTSLPDDVVDTTIEQLGKRYDKGGSFDAGVPGVKASLGHADNAERVFMRVQSKVVTVVPPDKAADFAKVLKRAPISPRVRPGEAMRLIVNDPWRQVSIPGLKFSQSLKQLRLWVVPRASDGGADLFIEGDCTDEAAAVDVADALTDIIKKQNTIAVRLATRGLFNNAKIDADGTRITSQLSVSRDQLEALLQTVAAFLNVQVQPAPGAP